MGPGNVGRRMVIDEPAKEKAGNGADADNGDDYTGWGPRGVLGDRRHFSEKDKARILLFFHERGVW